MTLHTPYGTIYLIWVVIRRTGGGRNAGYSRESEKTIVGHAGGEAYPADIGQD